MLCWLFPTTKVFVGKPAPSMKATRFVSFGSAGQAAEVVTEIALVSEPLAGLIDNVPITAAEAGTAATTAPAAAASATTPTVAVRKSFLENTGFLAFYVREMSGVIQEVNDDQVCWLTAPQFGSRPKP